MWLTRINRPVVREFDWINREFERMNREFFGLAPAKNSLTWDVNEDAVTVSAELPGINPDELDITVENRVLTIKGERKAENVDENETYLRRERAYGSFTRSLRLPYGIDTDNVEATYTDGILNVTLPRIEAEKPRKIAIKAGA